MQAGLSFECVEAERGWRYAVETDFVSLSPDSNPIETTILCYDSNDRYLPFRRSPTQSEIHHAFSEDERWLALAVGEDIDLYDLTNNERTTLKGHTVEINCVAFVPGDSNTLVSSARCWEQVRSWRETRKLEKPEIFIWDLKGTTTCAAPESELRQPQDLTNDLLKRLRTTLPTETPPTTLERAKQEEFTQTLETFFSRIANHSSARQIKGRLCSSYQSSTFNHAGTILIYLPGTSPQPHADKRWDITLYTLETSQTVTLRGHRDSITWISFSPDDKVVISASSDQTYRVWNPITGECIWTWHTGSTNVTGTISPDSQRFLGNDAGGVRVWGIQTGEILWSFGQEGLHRRTRLVDWSSDGRYLVVGSDADRGRILLFDTQRPVVDGILHPFQTRLLSIEESNLPPQLRPLVAYFLNVSSLKFIPSPDGEIMFGSTAPIDLGVEIVSLMQGKRWRIIPGPEPLEGDVQVQRYRSRPNGPSMFPSWTMLGKMGMMAVVSWDGVRFWKLE